MKRSQILAASLIIAGAVGVAAQQPAGRRDQNLTPEQQAQREQQRAAQALADGVRPIEALDTVWIEEQTWMETRDAIKAGKTTAIIGSGGLEKNGPYNANGKHNYVLRSTCNAIARRLGNALCAPIVTMEPGNVDNPNLTPGSVFITRTRSGTALRPACTTSPSTTRRTSGATTI
jgi:hypothetical protein